ncbi:hypothetical protein PBCVCvsA1_352R [Paramecium bursaria Chlorella virus CvsA1]|nr:hypothetical protein PBCVCvsA1_352R [Paramecium bursaria Chlorella virus CvsA1]AGE55285.1 hypothetical protein PBCVMA1E_381R [Paramecium bursaria Chlorella virus MA1E]
MVSKWVIITIAAVLVAVSVTIAAIIIILKRMNKDEKVNDEIFLKQKEELLRRAIDQKLDGDSNIVNVESSKILNIVNDGTQKASSSNDLLQKQISDQQKTIANLKKNYATELNKIK